MSAWCSLAPLAAGKAFLPIHSASSYCFRNSPAYIELAGAQFQKHGTGEFTAGIVLMERVDADGREPWTWVRTHGKGRVFYTAYGHDERVWSHRGVHRLIRNAIRWSTHAE